MALYQANCPCVCAHACSGEFQPGNKLPGATYLPICVAITKPILPLRNSGNETTALARSGLSVMPSSRWFMCATGSCKSRFHSKAFMLKSKWASIVNMVVLNLDSDFSVTGNGFPFAGNFVVVYSDGPLIKRYRGANMKRQSV